MYKYGVIVSELSVNKYNIFAYPLCFEIKNRRQGPKTAGYRRKLFRTLGLSKASRGNLRILLASSTANPIHTCETRILSLA